MRSGYFEGSRPLDNRDLDDEIRRRSGERPRDRVSVASGFGSEREEAAVRNTNHLRHLAMEAQGEGDIADRARRELNRQLHGRDY